MNKKKIVVMLDNGHGIDVIGKCSPDKSLLEWKYVREIVKELDKKLQASGVQTYIVCPENKEIGLTTRCNRANWKHIDLKKEGKTSIFVSVHVNAAGSGKWMTASGWRIYTSVGKTNADTLARYFYDSAVETLKPLKQRIGADWSDGDPDYEDNFTVLKKTIMPAVLTENFFMDNKNDVAFLLSDKGKQAIVDLHYNAIMNYLEAE